MTALLGTGMRVAECTGITKSDINLSENTISVNHNLIYRVIDGKAGFHITTPKTESGTRIIPILYPEVAEQLRLQIETIDALYPYRVIDGKAGFHITTPKTESGTRIIPILYPEVAEQLRLQIETIDALYPDDQLVLGGVHGFVFRNRTGSFMSAHNINRAIERISVTYNKANLHFISRSAFHISSSGFVGSRAKVVVTRFFVVNDLFSTASLLLESGRLPSAHSGLLCLLPGGLRK